jgi:hypothetical protein
MAIDDKPEYEAYLTDGTITGTLTIANSMVTPRFTFLGPANQAFVTISFDPPHVELSPGVDWDGAAKIFWNQVAKMAGQEPPFGW